MSHKYHLSVCLPYETKNPIGMISVSKGFNFVSLPTRTPADGRYVHVRKLIWVLEFLEANAVADDCMILFTDAHDVLLLADANEMYARFLRQDCDLLFSTEKLFSPDDGQTEPYRRDVKRFFETHEGDHAPYPNTGCWIGWGWAAKAFLRQVVAYAVSRGDQDDQRVVQDTLYHGQYGDIRIGLDVGQNLFVSVVHNGDQIRLRGDTLVYRDKAESIGVFHANGYKKALNFLTFHVELFHMTGGDMVDLRAVRQGDRYVCFRNGCVSTSHHYGQDSLIAVMKAGHRCCLVTNQGVILGIDRQTGLVAEGRLPAGSLQIIKVREIDDLLQCHLNQPARIGLGHLTLDDILDHMRLGIQHDLLRYFHSL